MHIAFFSNQFARSNGHGVARYAHNLLAAFGELDPPLEVTPVATWSNRDKDDLNALKAKTGLKLLPTGRILTRLLWLSVGIPKFEQLLDIDFDIVHVDSLDYSVATSKPYVVTVHDIGPLTHPEYFTKDACWGMKKNLEQAIKKAVTFICVSQTTANALLNYVQQRYLVDLSNSTYVVHEGILERFFQAPDLSVFTQKEKDDYLQQPFILAVGKISPRKNLEIVIRALKSLQSRIPHHLVTVGGDGWDSQSVKSLVKSFGLEDRVHFLGYVSDEVLQALYHKAALFIYPSLFEGFGLTILEAMASGCPVITSGISSLPEVAGDAALLVDPHNVEEIATAIEMICLNNSYADEFRHKGQIRAKMFSWKKCAKEVTKIYQGVV